MSQNPPHAVVLTRLLRVLAALFGLECLRIQAPITLTDADNVYNEPEPDAAITAEAETAYTERHPAPDDLRLVVEVADTTLRTDLNYKATLYARAGIADYWVVDLNARQLYRHRAPVEGEYREVTVHAETETIVLASHPAHSVAVADLLPPVTV